MTGVCTGPWLASADSAADWSVHRLR